MTLERWLKSWPYTGCNVTGGISSGDYAPPNGASEYVVADAPNSQVRTYAWDLDDYLVTAVMGGSIWFARR